MTEFDNSPPPRKPPPRLLAMLAAAVLAIAGTGYWWTGSPGTVLAPSPAASPEIAHIAAMVDKLTARLQAQPDDAVGWTMLARSYIVLGRPADAVPAYARAVALKGDDASLLADYADVLAAQNQGALDGEPMKLVARALALEPNNSKALMLAGTAAFDRKDFATAVRYWQTVLKALPADTAFAQQVQASIDQARTLGNLPATDLPTAAASTVTVPPDAKVNGRVSLAPAFAATVSPEDTVFVLARAAEGPRMPLAILRKQVKDLPFDFTLDDSVAMAPQLKLSGFAKVIVSARVSKSGDALPKAGDLLGQSAPVAPGATGLQIEINGTVSVP